MTCASMENPRKTGKTFYVSCFVWVEEGGVFCNIARKLALLLVIPRGVTCLKNFLLGNRCVSGVKTHATLYGLLRGAVVTEVTKEREKREAWALTASSIPHILPPYSDFRTVLFLNLRYGKLKERREGKNTP